MASGVMTLLTTRGQERYSTEIEIGAYRGELVLLGDSNGVGQQRQSDAGQQWGDQQRSARQENKISWGAGPDTDDDLPF
jgi:single-strand DNA-binding protein